MTFTWEPQNNKTCQILKAAEDGGYGVVAPIAYNIEHILAFVRAAEVKRSPLIIQVFPWAITFSSDLLIHAAAHAARNASVPVAIHLDHAQDEAIIRHAADSLPFDSIMVDMSHHEMEENLSKTKELVSYCHARGIATEAEPGRIEGGEDGIADTADLEGALTTAEQVEDFIATGIDFLAPAFGNVHGEYGKRGPVLEFDRLEMIRSRVNGRVRVVLHGTNDFPEDIMKACIKGGVSKVNVNKLVLDDYLIHIKEQASRLNLTTLMEEGVEKAQKLTEWQMDVYGSSGKA
ncbi:ketose-bisphosphate aldolase [Fusarium oxysporum II5]|uniref:Fructose-bisphosphate aldolase n=2 Tax=Fusarium oxysporum f. sp. cubense (strain race 4) TaxID=2502994 RepID=N1S8P5_FUSC4|nr:tagatose 1,6-diphosphate aldolase [Fusarium odoratissimum NRRL 54006]EMT74609.1 Putative fructose-bisphosphate aldolase [Fusarium odoratissimum]EXM02036.1 tagatose 1,6-diphosphate aldolase [Fusarium odoratissimum NRRL 54006]KAK2133884.1 ketose-bisphosphate aldolase [Fusarium oxysporum II5]